MLRIASVRGTVGVLRPAEGGQVDCDAMVDEFDEIQR